MMRKALAWFFMIDDCPLMGWSPFEKLTCAAFAWGIGFIIGRFCQ